MANQEYKRKKRLLVSLPDDVIEYISREASRLGIGDATFASMMVCDAVNAKKIALDLEGLVEQMRRLSDEEIRALTAARMEDMKK
jgi:hypothetical protein